MGKSNAPLSDRQREVLMWIRDGCPDGVWTDFTYKTTSYSLRDRGLVLVSKRHGVWRSEITAAGETYLEHGQLPVNRTADFSSSTRRALPGRPVEPRTPAAAPVTASFAIPTSSVLPRSPRPKRVSVSEQLIADIVAAGGELTIDTRTDKTNYQARISGAIRAGRVPPGKLLISDRRSRDDLVIRLADLPDWMSADLAPIPVPGTLRGPLPMVVSLRDDPDCLPIKAAVRNRALRLIQALTAAGTGRKYRFDRIVSDRRGQRPTGEPDGLFSASIGGHKVGVNLVELKDRIVHVPTQSEVRNAEKNTWVRIPTHDRVPSGRLQISVTNGTQYRQSVWADGTRRQLEDCLPEILQELELRAEDFEKRHQAKLRQQEVLKREWEEALERAKAEMAQVHRAGVLADQLQRWQRVQALSEYLPAMEHAIAQIDDVDERTYAEEWLTWARQHADDIDPLNGHLVMPAMPEPSPQNLEPFLGHRSFYGPRDW